MQRESPLPRSNIEGLSLVITCDVFNVSDVKFNTWTHIYVSKSFKGKHSINTTDWSIPSFGIRRRFIHFYGNQPWEISLSFAYFMFLFSCIIWYDMYCFLWIACFPISALNSIIFFICLKYWLIRQNTQLLSDVFYFFLDNAAYEKREPRGIYTNATVLPHLILYFARVLCIIHGKIWTMFRHPATGKLQLQSTLSFSNE